MGYGKAAPTRLRETGPKPSAALARPPLPGSANHYNGKALDLCTSGHQEALGFSPRPQFRGVTVHSTELPSQPKLTPLCQLLLSLREAGLVLLSLTSTHLCLQVETLLPTGLSVWPAQNSPSLDTPGSGLSAPSQLRQCSPLPLCALILPLNPHFSLVRNFKIPMYSSILLAL